MHQVIIVIVSKYYYIKNQYKKKNHKKNHIYIIYSTTPTLTPIKNNQNIFLNYTDIRKNPFSKKQEKNTCTIVIKKEYYLLVSRCRAHALL